MSTAFVVTGKNASAPFTLKVYRGEGMSLLAMNWKTPNPPDDFVGFAIEFKNPGGDVFYPLSNRINFPDKNGKLIKDKQSSRVSPIQMFRWVHFPYNPEIPGEYTYRVTPVFMTPDDKLSFGEFQTAAVELRRETYPGQLNVTFTRGFISSQAFVDKYQIDGDISTLLPASALDGLTFTPTHPKAAEALAWMGFEARSAIYEVLDAAIVDLTTTVRVVAYDLSERGFVERLEQLGNRLRIIIDDSVSDKKKPDDHGMATSGESQSAARLALSAGFGNVKRQHMGTLQHNKTIIVDGPNLKKAVCGSTNFSSRGFYVQSNNAVVINGASAIKPFADAFESYWTLGPSEVGKSPSAGWSDLGLAGIDAKVSFSPHSGANSILNGIANDIQTKTTSSLFYSLAFLYQTPGVILDAINEVTNADEIFVYGISDKKVGGIVLQKPDGNVAPVYPDELGKKELPAPFNIEVSGGKGVRLHNKFVIIDFNQPTARVYLGSYNFSKSADGSNGENLLLIKDKQVATSYVVAALGMFDHYSFRIAQKDAKKAKKQLMLLKPPRAAGEKPWWDKNYTIPQRIRDRELFA